MKVFFKTLFGDWVNLGFVTIVVVVETGLVKAGYANHAGEVTPLLILAGVGWLATR